MARPTSSSTEPRRDRWWVGDGLKRVGLAVVVVGLAQALVFYDHFAVALTLLFAFAIGLWLRSWTAAAPAVAAFLIGYALAAGTGWLHDARALWEPLFGVALAFLGGLIGGGIFDVLRRDVDARAPAPATMDSFPTESPR